MNPLLQLFLWNGEIMRMIDVVLNLDSLILKDDESVDDVVAHIRKRFSCGYEPTFEILYEEQVDE